MTILDGKTLSDQIISQLALDIADIASKTKTRAPRLDIILAGDDFASAKYVEFKQKAAAKAGVTGEIHTFDNSVDTATLVDLVKKLNSNKNVDGFMLQLPLPGSVDRHSVLENIDAKKDCDGLTSTNLGLAMSRYSSGILPATVRGILTLLNAYNISLEKKDVVIIGATEFVGLPLAGVLLKNGATVTVCHDKTVDIEKKCQRADILVSGAGVPHLVKSNWVKDGACVVDVGFSQDENGKPVGDIDFDNVAPKCSYISKVVGGVGPMTIASLLQNTFDIWSGNNR